MPNGNFDELFASLVSAGRAAYVAAREAVRALGEAAVAPLEARRGDPDWRVRLLAEILLGWIRTPALNESTVALARGDLGGEEARTITGVIPAARRATMLAALRAAVVPRLIELATLSPELDDDGEAVAAVLLALDLLRDARAVEPLVDVVETSPDAGRQIFALSALGSLGDPRGADAALAAFRDTSRGALVRGTAIACLGRLHDSRAIPEAIAAARDRNQPLAVREGAIDALGRFADPAAAAALAALVQERPEERLALAVVDALGRQTDPVAIAALESLGSTHADATVRRAAQDARSAIA